MTKTGQTTLSFLQCITFLASPPLNVLIANDYSFVMV